ncbi:MAG: NAD(P)-binding protein [Phycisphaerales bacterium]|nr:NAD(P)-binding protein [Phycisphaerales bacterium]
MRPDFVIIGSGLTGATLARFLTDQGFQTLVVERRQIIGGNVADALHPCGIRMGLHGPHYFRTSSDELWRFVNRFASFFPFEAVVKSRVRGNLENWPVAGSYIRRTLGDPWKPEYLGTPDNFEDASLAMMPRRIYEDFVKGYTEKQWGVSARTLSRSLAKRFDVRQDDDPRLTPNKKHQGIPANGYTAMVQRMLDGIPVELNCDYLAYRGHFTPKNMVIYTGAIDAYFNYCFGRLNYRAQRRSTRHLPDVTLVQPCVQINDPDPNSSSLRCIEWKHMLPQFLLQRTKGTLLTSETPCTPEPEEDLLEYPFPDAANNHRYQRYRALAGGESRVLICGRLGEYQYYDMDQAIARALLLGRRLLETRQWVDAPEPLHAAMPA